ncbi:hypothetical protein BGX38DRAFT_1140913 [Terfezia claveryi]|nr:hypothetical protein BGX38DRAFT_1140913 [Terfezia claveryi]
MFGNTLDHASNLSGVISDEIRTEYEYYSVTRMETLECGNDVMVYRWVPMECHAITALYLCDTDRHPTLPTLHATLSDSSTGDNISTTTVRAEHNDSRFLTVPTWKHSKKERQEARGKRQRKMLGRGSRKAQGLSEHGLHYEPDCSLKANEECQSDAISTESVLDSISDTPTNATETKNAFTQFSVGISPVHLLELPLIVIHPETPDMSQTEGLLRGGKYRDICSMIDELRLQSLPVHQGTRLLRLGLNRIATSVADPGTDVAHTKPGNMKELLAKVKEDWTALIKETWRVETAIKTSVYSRAISGELKKSHFKSVIIRLKLHQVEMVELQEECVTLQKGVESVLHQRRFSVPKLGLVAEKVRDLLHRK